VRRPNQQLAVVSHIIPTHAESPRVIRDAASLLQAENLARNCDKRVSGFTPRTIRCRVLSTSSRRNWV